MRSVVKIFALLWMVVCGAFAAQAAEIGELRAGQDIQVTIKEVKTSKAVVVVWENHELELSLSGLEPSTDEKKLTEAIKNITEGKGRKLSLHLDTANHNLVTGQLYSYAHLEQDEGRRKEVMDAVSAKLNSSKIRWFSINLNIRLIETGAAKYSDRDAQHSDEIFKALARAASK